MGAVIDALHGSGLLERAIDHLRPEFAHTVACPFLREQRHALAGVRIAIADNQVGMRIARVLPRLVQRRQP